MIINQWQTPDKLTVAKTTITVGDFNIPLQ